MNKSPGPEFGAMPKENTAGMITRPASNAAAVSKKQRIWHCLQHLHQILSNFRKQQFRFRQGKGRKMPAPSRIPTCGDWPFPTSRV